MTDTYPRFSWRDLSWTAVRDTFDERARLLALLRFGRPRTLAALGTTVVVSVAAAPLTALFAHDAVAAMSSAGFDPAALVWPVAGFAAAMLAKEAAGILARALKASASKRIDGVVRSRVRRIALRPDDIGHLEDPEFHDVAVRAGDQGITWRVRSPGAASIGQLEITARMASAAAMAVVLAAFFPVLAVVLLALSVLTRSITRRQWTHLEAVKDAATPERRKVDFWADLAASPDAGKEVRLFGLAGWVSERRLDAHRAWEARHWSTRRRVLRSQKATFLLSMLSAGLGLLVPGLAARAGELSIAGLSQCLVAAWGIFEISVMGGESYDIDYGKTAVTALRRLEGMAVGGPSHAGAESASPGLPPLVRFEDVSFTYPGASRPVLDRLNLTIRPGERLAIVGGSGAGKTTLVKLLSGLYRPTTGRITADGTDLRSLDAGAWRRSMTALFQDFVHYPLTARDNITLAAPEAPVPGDDSLMRLVRAGGAQPVLDRLESGLDTELWRTGGDGRDLSGGQWQKLAAIRALYAVAHGRRLVVLDEPTAHLDVKAEARFHEQVIGSVGGASVVLISHRLSTVRPADRIVLLQDGRIAEEGSHDELMRLGGEYARLFRLQSSRFHSREAR
ncbi:ABC transporter ATP-binding protein [Nonomuraea sp. PA05]|uniref:ABC transporter ATP-binding protein n=1 Tax=Nonomuraea sp. PA05 TaxID=2604466 RepID=UPI0011D8EDD3|nr:ABC transporter ATP-binding protein [Nonomuraea sp. PA05]TYB55056.1 ABC transporter ATP-binding protein [Nonomuraea sp. PA05]